MDYYDFIVKEILEILKDEPDGCGYIKIFNTAKMITDKSFPKKEGGLTSEEFESIMAQLKMRKLIAYDYDPIINKVYLLEK